MISTVKILRGKYPGGRVPVGDDSGSALIIVLWVVMLLSIIVASFSFEAKLEARLTSYYRKRTQADYLARAGLPVARMLLAKSREIARENEDEEAPVDDPWYADAERIADGLAVRGLEQPLGEGKILLDIVPEPARRNINKLGGDDIERERNMERILEVGDVPEEMWPGLIESFLDWIDNESPEQARRDGAETEDYYATLDPPYKAKNGPLDTVGELLLVKGFTPEILSGGVLETGFDDEEPVEIIGIEDLLTIYGDGKVNVNAASQRVLMTLPDMDEVVAGAIVEEREGWTNASGRVEGEPFESLEDLFQRLPELSETVNTSLKKYVSTGSTIYRITSVGEMHGVQRTIWCIVKFTDNKTSILRWREEG